MYLDKELQIATTVVRREKGFEIFYLEIKDKDRVNQDFNNSYLMRNLFEEPSLVVLFAFFHLKIDN